MKTESITFNKEAQENLPEEVKAKMRLDRVLAQVKMERQRQNEKWGVQNRNAVEWIAILTEEVGEASKEAVDFYFANGDINPHNPAGPELQRQRLKNFRKELIQVAAVAIQAVENIDRDY